MLRFRSNPLVDLRRPADLADAQREPLRELENDPDFYGVLVARPPLRMSVKSVPRATAELFERLRTPSAVDDDLTDLVLDGIFELETDDGFVSGADALPLLVADADDGAAGLSRDALLHGQDIESDDPEILGKALYHYNRLPLTPFWKSHFAAGPPTCDAAGWITSSRPGWRIWSAAGAPRRSTADVTYKLYISPRPERIREAFAVVVRVLRASRATAFKIGDSAAALLRPDKLVAYFAAREDLDECAEELRRELAGCDAHGVPFTAPLDDGGLLSWGVDPPEDDRALRWLRRESWRIWLVKRLAAALSIAKNARTAAAPEPWRFAVARARRHGVDVATWTPSPSLWSMA